MASVVRFRGDGTRYTWLQARVLEHKIVHFAGGGSGQRQPRESTTTRVGEFSSQDTTPLLGTYLDRAFDFQTTPQGDPNENCDSPASNHVDSQPKRANAAFQKPDFGRRD
jgi:hypothetical protein